MSPGSGTARQERRGERPRVLFVGHARNPDQATKRKWDAVSKRLAVRVVVESDDPAAATDARFVAIRPAGPRFLRGSAFYLRLPVTVWRQFREFRPDAVVSQSPYDAIPVFFGRLLARARSVPVVIEVHGDWRTATRHYGSHWRRLLAPAADRAALWSLRRADAIRAISPTMSTIAQEASGTRVTSVFPTFFEAETFFDTPPVVFPSTPTAIWIGSLQRVKNPALLAGAWRIVAARVPEARLMVVGSGPLSQVVKGLQNEYPNRVDVYSHLPAEEVKRTLDAATVLVLPSISEGFGRVIIESFARGRPVVGSRVGAIPDLVRHEVNGLLVRSNDVDALASAIARVLTDRALAAQLGQQAHADAQANFWPAERYANALSELVEDALATKAAQRG